MFAIVTFFEPNISRTLAAPTDLAGLCALLKRLVGEEAPCCVVPTRGGGTYPGDRDDQHLPVAWGQNPFPRARGRPFFGARIDVPGVYAETDETPDIPGVGGTGGGR